MPVTPTLCAIAATVALLCALFGYAFWDVTRDRDHHPR